MIDWHSHILPQMDDGSQSVEESLNMLKVLSDQGVSTVIATPHFYANDESVEAFLKRRDHAFSQLRLNLKGNMPNIILGAEVKYYQGISRLKNLKDLRIDNTEFLLLEMPVNEWSELMVRELSELSCRSGMNIILAHGERYFHLQKREALNRIFESDILIQVNASFFESFISRIKAISMLKKGRIQLIGSDCHNMTTRPPNVSKALNIIRKRFGDDFINQMNEYGDSLLEHI